MATNKPQTLSDVSKCIESYKSRLKTPVMSNLELNKHLADLQQILRASEPPIHSGSLNQTTHSKLKIADPPIFLNDGNPTWEDWHTDRKIKLDCNTNRDEKKRWVTRSYIGVETLGP